MVCNWPDQGFDGGADDTGQQEERSDQDVEERERGEGHSGGQICIIRQMNMSHECLKQTHGSFSTSVCIYSFNKKQI